MKLAVALAVCLLACTHTAGAVACVDNDEAGSKVAAKMASSFKTCKQVTDVVVDVCEFVGGFCQASCYPGVGEDLDSFLQETVPQLLPSVFVSIMEHGPCRASGHQHHSTLHDVENTVLVNMEQSLGSVSRLMAPLPAHLGNNAP